MNDHLRPRETEVLTLGVSSCLVGQTVRWDGTEHELGLLAIEFSTRIEFVPICPEVGIGLAVPRKPIRLVSRKKGIRAVDLENGKIDFTDRLQAYVSVVAHKLVRIHGYIFTERSPSCGIGDVKVFAKCGNSYVRNGTGIFARAVHESYPRLPIANAAQMRRSRYLQLEFIEQSIAYRDMSATND